MTMRLADYLMKRLADAGIDHIFTLPGGGAMHINDGLACEKRITPIPCHHEQACGIAAEAWGRIRQSQPGGASFGVAMVTTGPGATNIITPVAGAWIESVPLLVLSGQVKRADLLGDRPLRQGGVQEVDIISLVKPITKYAVTITDPQQIGIHLDEALHQLTTGRSGPVWLDIPLDVQAATIDPDTLPRRSLSGSTSTEQPHLVRLAELLAKAERPLLLAGHGVRLANASEQLLKLAEQLHLPLATTWNALDIIPFDHPLWAGRPGVVALRGANFAVQNCDLLISIGCRLDNIITAYNPRGFARCADKVVVDVDANEIAKLDMDIALPLVMDAADFIQQLAAMNLPQHAANPHRDWIGKVQSWKTRYPLNEGQPFPSSGPISHAGFINALSAAIPTNTLISTGSSGLAVEVFYTLFRNKPGQRVFLTSGLGSMGYGLPAAIGACLANNGEPMVAIESDGSLQLNLQEFSTLRALNLPICLVILNNSGYASIRNTQRNYFNERYLGTGPEANLFLPDLARIAATWDLDYLKLDDFAGLDAALQNALALPRPCIIDARLIPNETLAPKCAALPQKDGGMLSMPLEDMSPLLPLAVLEKEMLVPLLPQSLLARQSN